MELTAKDMGPRAGICESQPYSFLACVNCRALEEDGFLVTTCTWLERGIYIEHSLLSRYVRLCWPGSILWEATIISAPPKRLWEGRGRLPWDTSWSSESLPLSWIPTGARDDFQFS